MVLLASPVPLQPTATQIHSMTSILFSNLLLCKLVGMLTLHVGRARHRCKSVPSTAQTIIMVSPLSRFTIKVVTRTGCFD
jgi:hypothetical protein